jgi:cytochrome c oxidase subunit 2
MTVRRATLAAALVLLAGCSGVQAALDPAGDQAAATKDIWRLMLWICGFMYLLVMIFLGAALWRAQRRLGGEPIAEGHESPHDRPMQRALSGWLGLVVVGLLVLTIGSFLVDRRLAQASEASALKVKVTAQQWWWKVEYEGSDPSRRLTTANELHLPVGRPALIELHAEDVIHSFWIPNLGGKQDLIPGRVSKLLLTPRREGLLRGQCAEFCGLQHANMALDVTVESPQAFQAWWDHQLTPAPEPLTASQQQGKAVFLGAACSSCHQIQGADAMGQTGPNLTHLASRRSIAAGARPYSRGYLAAWISDPQTLKPGNHMPIVQLSPGELNALLDYLDSLK